jgi:hypothetical protein
MGAPGAAQTAGHSVLSEDDGRNGDGGDRARRERCPASGSSIPARAKRNRPCAPFIEIEIEIQIDIEIGIEIEIEIELPPQAA